jgi:membrane peptidoglycan carboxypeptidase
MSSGRRPRARFHASWSPASKVKTRRSAVRLLGVLGALIAVFAVGANVYAVSFWDNLPSVRNLDATQFHGDTVILDRNGQQIADVGIQGASEQGDRRVTVGLDEISPKIVQATVAVEDRTFWSNPGFDPQGIVRSALNNFRSGSITGGGSTITQQLAKQLFLTKNGIAVQSLSRKAQEIALAYQLTQTYSKQQILELYLNTSYYGAQQYGVQAAAQTYFHKDAKNVDLAQAAMLAGLPQSPDNYNPVVHFDAAKVRQKEVLDAMVAQGYVTARDAAVADAEQLTVSPPVNNGKAPRFVDYVLSELRHLGYDPGSQQLTVKTTLDLGKQALAEQVIADNFKTQQPRDRAGRLSSGMLAMDPKTGQILAYVGSPDPTGVADAFDFVTTPINPGSSVKSFTYGKAILDGKITMDTPIVDGPSPYVLNLPGSPPYKVTNYDLRTHGTLPARVAFASSLNIPAVKVEMTEGVPAEVDFYRQMGMLPRTQDSSYHYHTDSPETSYSASLTLGGFPITLLEEVSAYSAYADMGIYHAPEAILQVTGPRGVAPYQADPNRGVRQAVDPGVAFIIASILDNDNNRAPIFGLGSPLHLADRHAAAKTGTSENFHDGLTMGFTPDLVAGVWIGDTAGTNPKTGQLYTMTTGSDGVIVAAPAWHKFMEAALKGVPNDWYTQPADVSGPAPDGSFFLKSTPNKIDHLQGDDPSPTPSPGTNPFGIPPDPGRGPQPVDPRVCKLPIPIPGCPQPSPGVGVPPTP